MRLGRTARETLQEFIDIDVSASDLERILNENQVYRDLFFRFVNQKTAKPVKVKAAPKEGEAPAKPEKEEPQSPTHRLISLLGMLGSRNLILALRIHRLAAGRFPINEEGVVEIQASDYLKMALEAEDLFLRNKLEYSETAYAAGVYYDLCRRIYDKNDNLKKLDEYFKKTWQRAIRVGTLAYFLAERVDGYTPKTALAAGMLSQAGKLHLAVWLQEDNYAEFEEGLNANQEIPQIGRMLLERDKFGINNEEVAAHTLRYFDVFKGLASAIDNFREPYCLKGSDPSNHGLSILLWLADSMARTWKLPVDEKDPVFNQWTYPGLGALRIRKSMLIEVMKRAMTLK